MIEVTVRDLETGDTQTKEIKPGGYVVVCVEPAYVEHEQVYANGTRIVTVKKRAQTTEQSPSVGVDGPTCMDCGGLTQRTGTCYTCIGCGSTTGCG